MLLFKVSIFKECSFSSPGELRKKIQQWIINAHFKAWNTRKWLMCDSTHMSGSPPDINMQSAKEALFKMFTDQSTEKKKIYIYIYIYDTFCKEGTLSQTYSRQEENRKSNIKCWNVGDSLKWAKKKKKYSTSGEFILRPSLRLSPPSFHLPHHFVTDWDQGSSTFNRSNLGMSCKSIHCSVLGFAVG